MQSVVCYSVTWLFSFRKILLLILKINWRRKNVRIAQLVESGPGHGFSDPLKGAIYSRFLKGNLREKNSILLE